MFVLARLIELRTLQSFSNIVSLSSRMFTYLRRCYMRHHPGIVGSKFGEHLHPWTIPSSIIHNALLNIGLDST